MQAGVRPINNIVDITNFVMLEIGEPMHAYDAREISTNKIVVQNAEDGEKFTTLDEIERTLTKDYVCIKDTDKTIGLAGIMGGLDSEIKEDTTEVIFECANFDGTNIRVNSKALNLRTEASGRFEKDIDPNLAQIAIDRACALVFVNPAFWCFWLPLSFDFQSVRRKFFYPKRAVSHKTLIIFFVLQP